MTFCRAAGECRDHHNCGFSELSAAGMAREPGRDCNSPLVLVLRVQLKYSQK